MEARELAQRLSFPPPVVSAGIDLLLIYARSHDPGRADPIIDDVAKAVAAASGWHGWLWRLRLLQARAELAHARGDWQGAITTATEAIASSEARSRTKYIALGFITRALAQFRSGDRAQALADADRALAVARGLGDPAVLLKALLCRIEIEGTDDLANEARACREQILSNLDDAVLRERFLSSELAGVT
jgi:tetratricopeptide (TPR) repeat protein